MLKEHSLRGMTFYVMSEALCSFITQYIHGHDILVTSNELIDFKDIALLKRK